MKNGVSKPRILLVEDDVSLGFLLVDFLESNGFDVKLYKDGEAGLRGFQSGQYDFCILDVMLPKLDGFSLLEKIRACDSHIPVIILSARSLKEDKMKGFRMGIDDYVTKPFDEDELLYRIRAIMSRVGRAETPEEDIRPLHIGRFVFDRFNQLLKTDGRCQRLTLKEAQILGMLAESANNVVHRDEIMLAVWGDANYYTGRSLDVFISKLRSYLKDDTSLRVVTIPTVGYVLETI